MIRFYYEEQSRGRRFDIQNRLFIVHHSFVDPNREFYLTCAWESERNIYIIFSKNVGEIEFLNMIMFCQLLSLSLNENLVL